MGEKGIVDPGSAGSPYGAEPNPTGTTSSSSGSGGGGSSGGGASTPDTGGGGGSNPQSA